MFPLAQLRRRIIQRLNIALRHLDYDSSVHAPALLLATPDAALPAAYIVSPRHPLDLRCSNAALTGSTFLGSCRIKDSIVSSSIIRGDELLAPLADDQPTTEPPTSTHIDIAGCFLDQTLVFGHSSDPNDPERYVLHNTLALPHCLIQSAPTIGCLLGPVTTLDHTCARSCIIGSYSYIQAGNITRMHIPPGTVWIRKGQRFNFLYRFPPDRLRRYIWHTPGNAPQGMIPEALWQQRQASSHGLDRGNDRLGQAMPASSFLDRQATILATSLIMDNVLVCRHAVLSSTSLGRGCTVLENCLLDHVRCGENAIIGQGAKVFDADIDSMVMVGGNTLLRGRAGSRLNIGTDCIIAPHTIIDSDSPLTVPPAHLVWGLSTDQDELASNSLALEELDRVGCALTRERLYFEGDGSALIKHFTDQRHHLLLNTGAFSDGTRHRGQAQDDQHLSRNTVQPFQFGERQGMYPTMTITT
jgi:carbonic anhydrase/acetyltransferase-like protein (isoleucine patch superfamily)